MTNEFLNFQLQDHELEDVATLNEWLPPTIFDSHVHTAFASPGMKMINSNTNRPGETFNFFDWELHCKILKAILPKPKYFAAAFGFPHMPNNSDDNRYILSLAEENYSVIPIFRMNALSAGINLQEELSHKFAGLKMYPSNQQKRVHTKITDIFPRSIIEIANTLSKPLIIHLPNGLAENLEELIALAEEFPNAKFILAHMGVFYCYDPRLENALSEVKRHKNILFDTAMVSNAKVISRAIEVVGPERILFGSDAPFSYFRGGFTIGQDGRLRFYSQTKFSWVKSADRELYADKISTLKLAHINILMAIKKAIEVLAPASHEHAKLQIFWRNSRLVF